MRAKQKILIFQIGSLGDTVIAMPCYREIARRNPNAERYLLTNFPIARNAVPSEAMLTPCGLIEGCIEYPMPLRGAMNIARMWRKLRALQIDALYYLTPEKSLMRLVRHYAFFRACGIRKINGIPWSRAARLSREIVPGVLWESEASRLLRCLEPGRRPGPPSALDRSLDLTAAERRAVERLLAEVPGMERFVAICVGGKLPVKDWGDDNWARALAKISATAPDMGAVFVGSADERERNERLAQTWAGPRLNSCGRLTPRETAALIERATLYLGHDAGPIHLAAAVNTRVIGIFCAREAPGRWYSDRPGDQFFYQRVPCFGCELEKAEDCPYDVLCMKNHKIDEIVGATTEALSNA
jgi:ADP-heptose:LPS heptosyltransferase